MGKKKNKIPKNRDIEDIVFKEDNETIKTMEDIVKSAKNEENKEDEEIKTEREQFTEAMRASIAKKTESYSEIKDSKRAEQKRQAELLKIIQKNREQEEENSL